jgi:hypothetical protein
LRTCHGHHAIISPNVLVMCSTALFTIFSTLPFLYFLSHLCC